MVDGSMPSARAAWPASRLGDLVESHSSTWSPSTRAVQDTGSMQACDRSGVVIWMTGVCLLHLGQCLDGLPILVGDNRNTLWHGHDQSDARHGLGLGVIDCRDR